MTQTQILYILFSKPIYFTAFHQGCKYFLTEKLDINSQKKKTNVMSHFEKKEKVSFDFYIKIDITF